jgi:1,4-dihydroxy-2-naphthoate octaprenyltransferase
MMILSEETMESLAKPVIAGGVATVLSMYFTQGDLYRSHLPLGGLVALSTFGTRYVSKYIPDNDAKTLESRALEVGASAGLYYGFKMFSGMGNEYATVPQTLGIILASDVIADYVDDMIYNRA